LFSRRIKLRGEQEDSARLGKELQEGVGKTIAELQNLLQNSTVDMFIYEREHNIFRQYTKNDPTKKTTSFDEPFIRSVMQ
jgi:hypothetical protein